MDAASLVKLLVEVSDHLGVRCRAKTAPSGEISDWTRGLITPTQTYLESSAFGPLPARLIEWLEFDPIVFTWRGRLVPDLREDKANALREALAERTILFEDCGEFVRIIVAANCQK